MKIMSVCHNRTVHIICTQIQLKKYVKNVRINYKTVIPVRMKIFANHVIKDFIYHRILKKKTYNAQNLFYVHRVPKLMQLPKIALNVQKNLANGVVWRKIILLMSVYLVMMGLTLIYLRKSVSHALPDADIVRSNKQINS